MVAVPVGTVPPLQLDPVLKSTLKLMSLGGSRIRLPFCARAAVDDRPMATQIVASKILNAGVSRLAHFIMIVSPRPAHRGRHRHYVMVRLSARQGRKRTAAWDRRWRLENVIPSIGAIATDCNSRHRIDELRELHVLGRHAAGIVGG